MSNDTHPDLKWLAENVSEWSPSNCFCDSSGAYLIRKTGPGTWMHCGPNSLAAKDPMKNCFTKAQWLQARRDLGLVMTEQEAELPAQECGADGGHDPVNKPKHYQLREGYEVYDLRQDLARKAQAAGVPHDQFSDWDRALEYLLRMWDKNGVEDAKKGAWYVNKLVGKLEASALRAKGLEG